MNSLLGDRRAVSKEGMAALGFALTVVMIGVTGALLMQSGDSLTGGGPILSAETETLDASNGPDGQWLRISHASGDAVDVANLSINVTISDHRKRTRLHGLPTDELEQSDYEGNHVFTLGPDGVDGAAVASDTDQQWGAGETIAVRIEPRRVDLQPGDIVRVTVRYIPEDRPVYSETVEVV